VLAVVVELVLAVVLVLVVVLAPVVGLEPAPVWVRALAWPGNHLGYCRSSSTRWSRDRLLRPLGSRRKCWHHPTCSSNSWGQHLPERPAQLRVQHAP
jgi:hypothetical protein